MYRLQNKHLPTTSFRRCRADDVRCFGSGTLVRSFTCTCGNRVYFENDRCLACGVELAFDVERLTLRGVRPGDRHCANRAALGTCNWLVSASGDAFCKACALNEIVPDLSEPRRVSLYYEVEKAKRRLLFTLFSLGLPVEDRAEREDGLTFHILADARLDGVDLDPGVDDAVVTGHLEGRITINLLEADPHLRERMRMAMNESYRTLLGHFRHESGHYYWQRLVAPDPTGFREVFGDERAPYREALDAYYGNGPPANWQESYIDAYAASHPLEDFAECWAHYLHMMDTLETAAAAGVVVRDRTIRNPFAAGAAFDRTVQDWGVVTEAVNDLNRSLGLDDAYPFAISQATAIKLAFVRGVIGGP